MAWAALAAWAVERRLVSSDRLVALDSLLPSEPSFTDDPLSCPNTTGPLATFRELLDEFTETLFLPSGEDCSTLFCNLSLSWLGHLAARNVTTVDTVRMIN